MGKDGEAAKNLAILTILAIPLCSARTWRFAKADGSARHVGYAMLCQSGLGTAVPVRQKLWLRGHRRKQLGQTSPVSTNDFLTNVETLRSRIDCPRARMCSIYLVENGIKAIGKTQVPVFRKAAVIRKLNFG
eukprot:s296_g4.t1